MSFVIVFWKLDPFIYTKFRILMSELNLIEEEQEKEKDIYVSLEQQDSNKA